VVLTVPKALHLFFHRDQFLLAALMQCGGAMFQDTLAGVTRGVLDVGSVVVLETAGRAGHWNPHLHMLMTSGGVTPAQRWREVDDVPCAVLHKKWPYSLFTMLKERVKPQAMRQLIDALGRQYPRGLVAYLAKGKVPGGGAGLAYSLAQDVVRPPIALRRILRTEVEDIVAGSFMVVACPQCGGAMQEIDEKSPPSGR